MPRIRVILNPLLSISALLALTLLAPATASATTTPGQSATPFNEGGEWWSSDGCTDVPDSGTATALVQYGSFPYAYTTVTGYYDFHHACVHHDGCYRYHWSDRATCDAWFRNDMRASCDALHSNAACYAQANLYYLGVRALGQWSWDTYSVQVPMQR